MFRTQKFQKSYLILTALVIGSFGPIFFLGTIPFTSEPARWSLDLLSWPLDGKQTYTDSTTIFLSALTGGFLFGWGICVYGPLWLSAKSKSCPSDLDLKSNNSSQTA